MKWKSTYQRTIFFLITCSLSFILLIAKIKTFHEISYFWTEGEVSPIEVSPIEVSPIELRQRERQHLFQTSCEKKIRVDSKGKFDPNATMAEIRNSTWFMERKLSLHHVFNILHVNDEKELLYCSIPKVASSSLKSVFMQLQGILKTNKTQNVSLTKFYNKLTREVTYLKKFKNKKSEFLKRLNEYGSFFFVRNPFERLLSAYISKLLEPMEFDVYMIKKYRIPIIEKYQPNATLKDRKAGNGMEFISFIKFLLEKEKDEKKMNMHWSPYHYRCGLCYIDYDFIGHYETFNEDIEYLLNRKNMTNLVKVPSLNQSKHGKSRNLLKEYYSQIPSDMIRKLYAKYRMDFEMFGYDYPEEIKEILNGNRANQIQQ